MVSKNNIPGNFHLSQNFPNPFNPVTKIHYEIRSSGKVVLKIFDVLGREIRTVVDAYQNPGQYSVSFNATNLPSGIYLYQLTANGYIAIKKMILLK